MFRNYTHPHHTKRHNSNNSMLNESIPVSHNHQDDVHLSLKEKEDLIIPAIVALVVTFVLIARR